MAIVRSVGSSIRATLGVCCTFEAGMRRGQRQGGPMCCSGGHGLVPKPLSGTADACAGPLPKWRASPQRAPATCVGGFVRPIGLVSICLLAENGGDAESCACMHQRTAAGAREYAGDGFAPPLDRVAERRDRTHAEHALMHKHTHWLPLVPWPSRRTQARDTNQLYRMDRWQSAPCCGELPGRGEVRLDETPLSDSTPRQLQTQHTRRLHVAHDVTPI